MKNQKKNQKKKRERIVRVVAAVVLSSTACTRAMASEPELPSCPDMTDHKRILEQGVKSYEAGPSSDRSPAYGVHRIPFDGMFSAGQNKQHFRLLTNEELESLPLETASERRNAKSQVLDLETQFRFAAAYKLLERVLQTEQRRQNTSTDGAAGSDAIADTLNVMARLKLEEGIQVSEVYLAKTSPSSYAYGPGSWRTRIDPVPALEAAMNEAPADRKNEFWTAALQLYEKASYFRSESISARNLFDPAFPLLLEWNGQITTARIFYENSLSGYSRKSDFSNFEEFSRVLVNFCRRNNQLDLARQVESPLLATDSANISPLLWFYVQKGHEKNAQALFSLIVDASPQFNWRKVALKSDLVSAVVPVLQNSDEVELKKFLLQNFRSEDPQLNYEPIFAAAAGRGWKDLPQSLFEEIKKHHITTLTQMKKLVGLGTYFANREQYALALSTAREIITTLQRTEETNVTAKLGVVSAVQKMLSQEWAGKSSEGLALGQAAEKQCEQYQKQIEIAGCMKISNDLEQVAEQLENANNYGKAEQLYRESLTIKNKNLGPQDPDTVLALADVARVVGRQGRLNEAVKLYEQALKGYRDKTICPNRTYGTLLESYAQLLAANKQTAKAKSIYDEASAFYRKPKVLTIEHVCF